MYYHSLMLVKMQFFKDIAYVVLQTYLTQFESDAPVVPSINNEMVEIFTKIMQFLIKRNLLEEASSDYKPINIDVTKKENRMESAAIKLLRATNNLILKMSYFKGKKKKNRGDCAAILMSIILKMQERSPVEVIGG